MRSLIGLFRLVLAISSVGAVAQTVTGSGTSGTVPVFNGSSTVTNSPIAVSGGNVGVGTTTPGSLLTVGSGTAGKLVISSQDASYGQIQLGNPASNGETSMSFVSGVTAYGTPMTSQNGTAGVWNIGVGNWSSGSAKFNIGNVGFGGPVVTAQSNGNVGIGATAPAYKLDVAGQIHSSAGGYVFPDGTTQTTAFTAGSSGYLYLTGNTNPITTVQGTYLGWNAMTQGYGETDFINNPGLGPGGFAFMSVPNSGSPRTTLMFITNSGNVGIGTFTPGTRLEINGSMKLSAGTGASITFADGTTQTTAWTGAVCGGDYAESVDVSGSRRHYEPGDVLVVDDVSPGKVRKSGDTYSTLVAGIYSTKPGVVGRRQASNKSPDEVPMAMVGIVPAKVSAENGAVKPGDLLVSAATPGYAMKGTDRGKMLGAIVGKAMGSLEAGKGIVEVLVTLQ